MKNTNTPTPRAAILDRITEDEVAEWLKAQIAEARKIEPTIYCLEVNAYADRSPCFGAWSRDHNIHSGSTSSLGAAVGIVRDDIKDRSVQKRRQAAALIAEAEALEAEGAK